MEIYTIGFGQKTAEQFFGIITKVGIRRLMDVRLNNVSQLAGFTKKDDLRFFLKRLCSADYVHERMLAPTQDLLDGYKKEGGSWENYETKFLALMSERKIEDSISRAQFDVPTVMLCSEPTAEHCHRRLVVEYLNSKWGNVKAVHL